MRLVPQLCPKIIIASGKTAPTDKQKPEDYFQAFGGPSEI
jgi:hypothetical protein